MAAGEGGWVGACVRAGSRQVTPSPRCRRWRHARAGAAPAPRGAGPAACLWRATWSTCAAPRCPRGAACCNRCCGAGRRAAPASRCLACQWCARSSRSSGSGWWAACWWRSWRRLRCGQRPLSRKSYWCRWVVRVGWHRRGGEVHSPCAHPACIPACLGAARGRTRTHLCTSSCARRLGGSALQPTLRRWWRWPPS